MVRKEDCKGCDYLCKVDGRDWCRYFDKALEHIATCSKQKEKIKVIKVEKKGNADCDHDWVYDNRVLMSDPPIYRKICKKCGRIVREQTFSKKKTFDELYDKFHGGKDEEKDIKKEKLPDRYFEMVQKARRVGKSPVKNPKLKKKVKEKLPGMSDEAIEKEWKKLKYGDFLTPDHFTLEEQAEHLSRVIMSRISKDYEYTYPPEGDAPW